MKYGIVGSRKRFDKSNIIAFVRTLKAGDIVISGGCRGVDSWAVEAARQRGLETVEYRPDLAGCREKYEFAKAYYARNKQIAEACDVLAAFVGTKRTGGTENTIKHAQKAGKPVLIFPPGAKSPHHPEHQYPLP